MARHIRQGDTVRVRSGDDKGRTGRVLRVMPDHDLAIVQGVNVHAKHVRPSQQDQRGGVIEKELPVHLSNLQPVDGSGKPTRVRFETRPDGSKVRVAATTGEQLGPELKKARNK